MKAVLGKIRKRLRLSLGVNKLEREINARLKVLNRDIAALQRHIAKTKLSKEANPTGRTKEAMQRDKKEVARIRMLLKSKSWPESKSAIAYLLSRVDEGIGSYLAWPKDIKITAVDRLGSGGEIVVDKETMWEVGNLLRGRPVELLNLPSLRARLSRQRRLKFTEDGRMRLLDETDNIIKNAVVHNVEKLDESSDDGARPLLLINPLTSIDYVATHKREMKILTIGSRSESELFCLYAAGFDPDKIEAVDLISYTPLIGSGDAHHLDFADSTFDIIIAGWVLAYSRNPHIMAAEMMRVAKPHAYIAAGCAYTPPGRGKGSSAGTNISGSRFSSIEDITKLFDKRLARVLFQSPIERERVAGSAALAVIMQMDG